MRITNPNTDRFKRARIKSNFEEESKSVTAPNLKRKSIERKVNVRIPNQQVRPKTTFGTIIGNPNPEIPLDPPVRNQEIDHETLLRSNHKKKDGVPCLSGATTIYGDAPKTETKISETYDPKKTKKVFIECDPKEPPVIGQPIVLEDFGVARKGRKRRDKDEVVVEITFEELRMCRTLRDLVEFKERKRRKLTNRAKQIDNSKDKLRIPEQDFTKKRGF